MSTFGNYDIGAKAHVDEVVRCGVVEMHVSMDVLLGRGVCVKQGR